MNRKNNNLENQKKQAKVAMECPICGEIHERNEICPIVLNKIKHFSTLEKEKIFIWGNIFIECKKRNVNFGEILKEITYLDKVFTDFCSQEFHGLNMQLIVDYFSCSLECRESLFFKRKEQTTKEFYKILCAYDFENGTIEYGENGEVERIVFDEKSSDDFSYYLKLIKYKNSESEWRYKIVCETLFHQEFVLTDMYGAEIVLLDDDKGLLKELFEDCYNLNWTQIAKIVPNSDVRFDIWLDKFLNVTLKGLMNWKKYVTLHYYDSENTIIYSSQYKDKEIQIWINSENEYGNTDKLFVRFDDLFALCVDSEHKIEDKTGMKKTSKLLKLIQEIENYIERKKEIENAQNDIKLTKYIKSANVIVITQSFFCKEKNHDIVPCRGIVDVKTNGKGIISFPLYVGYCKECQKYYMFKTDFLELLKNGEPMCDVIYIDEKKTINNLKKFSFRSKSILNKMGYNVQENSGMSEKERREILIRAVESGKMSIHEEIDLLNLFIRIREKESKYVNAIKKWKSDISFLKTIKSENVNSVKVSSISVKTYE